ncbi:MAG: hypothetical protein JO000_05895 [Alphaproteobacteria bacterium]|nr:hypothetical protein [Alphaproteobacteria bacterium]
MRRLLVCVGGFAAAGLLFATVPASAQYYEAPGYQPPGYQPPGFQPPRPPMAVGIGPGLIESAAEIVEAMGLQPVGPALRSGAFLVQRATDDYGRVLRVTVDARRSQVIAIEANGAPRGPYARYASPYGPYGGPAPGPYAGTGPAPALAPPGSVMAAREPVAHPPYVAPPAHSGSITPDLPAPPTPGAKTLGAKTLGVMPRAKSAAVTPQHPPTPRKRPVTAPQQAVGSVEPVAPQSAPAPAPAPQAAPPAAAKPAASAMPPVTPLE